MRHPWCPLTSPRQQGQSSNRYEFFVDHSSKHQEASRCCKDPTKIHNSNRKKIFVNFEPKEIRTYDKKSKTRVTKVFPPGKYHKVCHRMYRTNRLQLCFWRCLHGMLQRMQQRPPKNGIPPQGTDVGPCKTAVHHHTIAAIGTRWQRRSNWSAKTRRFFNLHPRHRHIHQHVAVHKASVQCDTDPQNQTRRRMCGIFSGRRW